MVLQDSAFFPEGPFRLVPGVLDLSDVVVVINETVLVFDPSVMDVRNVGGGIASPAVRLGSTTRTNEWRGFPAAGIGILTGVGVPGLIRLGLGSRQRWAGSVSPAI